MASGIRATIEFTDPELCPAVELSSATGSDVGSMAANVCSSDSCSGVTEFSMGEEVHAHEDVDLVFAHGTTYRYRYTHEEGVDCPCECIGEYGCPIVRYTVRDGTLTLAFHAADYEQLEAVVSDLRERFPSLNIKRFVRSPPEESPRDSVFVDRSKLTPRQREILRTAYEHGYFERPRRSNASELAAELDISPSTFGQHLAVAQRKLLEDVLEDGS
ncbi:MAG: helix-turn-helix domain-containing protein [Haloarculaceae archaeon]